MEKQTIKVNFEDFGTKFDKLNNEISNILKKRYNLEISNKPDFLFYSCYRDRFKKYKNCVKIFCANEYVTPNFNDCDYAYGFDNIEFDDRYFKITSAAGITRAMQNRENLEDALLRRKFCNFVYHNKNRGEGAILRQEFCKKLMKYKNVDCAGSVLNNVKADICARYHNNWQIDKINFLKNYKFTIAFENHSIKSYTSEKIIHAYLANSIPIYWGNPSVCEIFNENSFINCNNFKNFDEVVEFVKELDCDDKKYMQMLRAPYIKDESIFSVNERFENFLYRIIDGGNKPFYKSKTTWSEEFPLFSIKDKGVFKVVNLLGWKFKVN